MQHDDAAYLLDMLLAARDALDFAAGLTHAQFAASRLHQNAIRKAIEIIGESAARVSPERREALPSIPWALMSAMRNRLVHAYFEIDLERVWETVQQDIPRLIELVAPLVPPSAE